MSHRCLAFIGALAGAIVLLQLAPTPVAGQALSAGATTRTAAKAGPAPTTPWGDGDLQGIWTAEFQIPLQRPARYAGREFLTDAEVAALDEQRVKLLRRDYRAERGTEEDVAGAYNAVFTSVKPSGRRTSMIVDPPDGRIPPVTPQVQKRREAIRELQLALLQPTETCKKQEAECRGGKYGPPSPRRAEPFPYYNMTAIGASYINRSFGPEDRTMGERCMSSILPDFGGFREIVQSPGSVTVFYDVGQGQGWARVIPVTTSPHLSSNVGQWWGDSRGRWEGKTLVVDVTNFTPKTDFAGSRENLHLVERWTRTGPDTLEYVVTMDDPTTWTKPWTVKQELTRQDAQANRIYHEPRCHEGNYGLMGLLAGARTEERAFAEGKGPDPATRDTAGTGNGPEDNQDPLAEVGQSGSRTPQKR